jgi:hypothetical protein
MNDHIITREECASCRYCCVFDSSDLKEMPIIPDAMKKELEKSFPDLRFHPHGDCWMFQVKPDEAGVYRCPMLSEQGCILGDQKPFDCLIYPFCIMRWESRLIISLTSECAVAYNKPLAQIMDVLEQGLADRIFAEAKANPDLVRDYVDGIAILKISS